VATVAANKTAAIVGPKPSRANWQIMIIVLMLMERFRD